MISARCEKLAGEEAMQVRDGSVESVSGIGGRMVRTKRGKANRARTRIGSGDPAVVSELAEKGLADEGARAMIELAKSAFSSDKCTYQQWEVLWEAGNRDEEPGVIRNGFSQAKAWAAEPEWLGESSEAAGESGGGSREPEGYGV